DPETFPKLAIIECNGRDLARQAEYVDAVSSMGLRIWRVGDDLWCLSDALIKDHDQQLSDLTKEIHPEPRNIQSQTADSDSKNQTIKVGSTPIPKKLGHIWIGDRQPPLEWMETWKQKHPDWDYQLFDNSYLSSRRWRCEAQIAEYMKRRQYAGVSDLMRYEILLEQGGFLPEADSICLRNVDELFVLPSLYTAYEHETKTRRFVSPFYASSPGHSFLAQILDEISQLQAKSLLTPFKSVGSRALRDFIKKRNPDISIFPSYFFNPRHHRGETYNGDGPVYAEQLWGTTKGLYKNLPDDQRAAALATTENLTEIWQGLPVNS
ncbi:glycosyltransferase, partial [Planktomarina sp.]|uniref:glycosyltransferase family 32 protein n=1 Tax=Planktomarina sp. TaxID=2024851 RepID=UPI00326166E9